MRSKNIELKVIFWIILCLYAAFMVVPLFTLFVKTFLADDGSVTGEFFRNVVGSASFGPAFLHSFLVAAAAALTATVIAFVMAYVIRYTQAPKWFKMIVRVIAMLPMYLPTITYGFAIIYSFGKMGLITRIFGRQLFDIYGFTGLMVGYVIYTIPVAFLLIQNTMEYIDKKTIIVSRLMGDNRFSTFWISVFRPLLGTLAGAFIQAFFLSFTDFGIPASVGGKYDVIATLLYNQMLGGIPDFNKGAVIAVMMLIPSVISICLLQYLEKFNIRYNTISELDPIQDIKRDVGWSAAAAIFSVMILSIFLVIFVVPNVKEWPYMTQPSLEHWRDVLTDGDLTASYIHSVIMAFSTALLGTLLAYGAALITARSTLGASFKKTIDSLSIVTNAIPGMVLGVAYMFVFPGTPLWNTLLLMILCNIVHYFSTPYLMMKNSLSKMNAGWETTALLMGDTWSKTIIRVVTPNALPSLIDVFSYYFVNAMVTISAIIFIAGARSMVMTTKIKQMQYINKFNEVFVLSLLIFFTNIAAKCIFTALSNKIRAKEMGGNKI